MKGFYKIPSQQVGSFVYGDMTGHRIDLIGTIDSDTYYYVSDDDCPIPQPQDGTDSTFQAVTLTPNMVAALKPQAAGDIRELLFPEVNLLKFNQMFAEAVTDGIFTDEQFLKAQRFQLVLDEDKRNGSLIELIRDGLPDQQIKLYEIAGLCGIPLPPIEMLQA
jgi:hypothetical protein